ncbi:Para-aminobenzoate synthase, aminase component [Thioalkalivibrio nitratireducens DSM 14787]|uniref:Para-aminobenzoate synthase, aminase component n=1 Tax=Thioalkalivibrio nitratireducens (strain DSM 14787 / UNIQEM 213 / ALEN2) TaxID=1255043 RepID=L0DW95_THIND|nr:aminodeoxychorismate synthase component I [Thioalkalivibrio nitratireducens]AGA33250.1 Para-aminobenzoate synthase, aminase component [Thioalkalivibrio nitratireducens DSM 14787]
MSVRPLATGADLLALARSHPRRYPHLLDTALIGQAPARFSILFAFPGATLTGDAVLEGLARLGPFDEMRRPQPAPGLPFAGGWFVYLGYELAWSIEPSLGACTPDPWLPSAVLTRFPAALILDHWQRRSYFVDEDDDPQRWEQVRSDLADLRDRSPAELPPLQVDEDDPEQYRRAVRRALRYIRDGDCFQANLSREWRIRSPTPWDTADLYERLRRANPAPFAAWLRLPGAEILSSSPERLVGVRHGVAEARPIAGTRRRDADATKDDALSNDLKVNRKEIAEHVMLVDLERNDLGRVAVPGSVRVPEFMTIESYRRVHHIVSSVQGRLRPGSTPADLVRACFPGGTITGCPKIRSMQIIRELEQGAPRGAYTGSCGYISRHGWMDTNILIRTLVVRGHALRFRTGAGIVADSDPEAELQETRHKAQGLLDALTS